MSEQNTVNVILPRTALWAIIMASVGLTLSSAWFVVNLDKRLGYLERGGTVVSTDMREHEREPWHGEAGRKFAAIEETLKRLENNSDRQTKELSAMRQLLTQMLIEQQKKQ